MAEQRIERFNAWSDRIGGILGLVVVAAVVVVGAAGVSAPYHPAAYPICGLIALLVWALLLRPAVSVEGDRLVLRNTFTTVHVPLAAIEQVAVRQWLAVRVGERRFTNASVGRSRRQGARDARKGEDATDRSYGAFVEVRIQKLAEEARTRQGVALHSDEQEALAAGVRRELAWVEIGVAVALGLAVVVTLLV